MPQQDQDPINFQFENRSSIVTGKTNIKAKGGDDQVNMEFDEDDDLNDNQNKMGGDSDEGEDPLAQQFEIVKKEGLKRKLTVEEQNELRST